MFNRIGTTTTWNDAAEKLNANFNRIATRLEYIRGDTVTLGRSIKYGNTTIAAEESITDALEQVAQSIEEVASAEIPDGSIIEPKLSEDVREKLNHDNGYWFYVEEEVAVLETETEEQTTVYKRSLIY